ncbi:MAG: hypothetical protein GQ582_07015 [Methyloprofundus sp.]|nr:hypothetical protein [Methyloprofundus sp.]
MQSPESDITAHTPPEKHRHWFFLLSILTPLVFSLFILARRSRYFFTDDKIADSIPKAFDIGRLLRQGEIPWLSTNMMNGGAYAIEYQYAVFNPVRLLIDFSLPSFSDYAVAAWFIAAVYMVIIGMAGFILGRNLGLRAAESLTLSTIISVGFYSIYWNASSWLVTFAGFCWLVCGLAFLAGIVHGERDKLRMNLIALFFIYYLCLTAGRPAAVVALATASIVVLVHLFWVRKDHKTAYALLAMGSAGALCAMPALLPLFSVSEIGTRSSSFSNKKNFLVAPLDGLISFSDPTYYPFLRTYGGYKLVKAPSFYTAWFLLPLLCIIDFSWQKFKDSGAWIWATLALIYILAAMGPDSAGFLRYPLRYVPYFQMCFAALLLFSLRQFGFKITQGRIKLVYFLLFLQCIHSIQSNPKGTGITILTTLAIAWLATKLFQRIKNHLDIGVFLYLTSLLVLVIVFLIHKEGRGHDWGFPADTALTAPLGRDAGNYTLFYGGYVDSHAKPNPHYEYRIASTGALVGDRSINGYTPVGHKGFREVLKIDDHGNFGRKSAIAKKLFHRDEHTGLTSAQLMRIDRVIVRQGIRTQDFLKYRNKDFSFLSKGEHTRTFDYRKNYDLPGLVSWVSPNTQVSSLDECQFQHSNECLQVTKTTGQGGEVIFARLWFPGYAAFLDGEELEVSAHRNLWTKVDLPPAARGKLVLKYAPPKLSIGLWLAALGLLVFTATVVVLRRKVQE